MVLYREFKGVFLILDGIWDGVLGKFKWDFRVRDRGRRVLGGREGERVVFGEVFLGYCFFRKRMMGNF